MAALTITADNQSKVYGAALPTLTASYVGFVNGDTPASLSTVPTLTTTATAASHVGSYSITASGAADSDYTFSYVGGKLTVTPASLTVTANNQGKVYGAALPSLTASYSGFVNGDTAAVLSGAPALSTTATAASDVGTYPISVAVGTLADSDYTFAFVNGTLTVTPASTTTGVASSLNPSVYGQAVTFTATVSPVAPGAGTPTGNVQFYVDGSPFGGAVTLTNGAASLSTKALFAGQHSVSAVFTSGSGDFSGSTSTTLTQTVTPAVLKVHADDKSKVYGAALPALTAGVSGFVNGDTASVLSGAPALATTATTTSPVGAYPITTTPGTLCAANYTFAFVSGTLTVTPASTSTTIGLTTSITPSVYGQAVTFTATVSPATAGAGTPTGCVTFLDGTTTLATVSLSGGAAMYTTDALVLGSHTITAVYSGDGNFTASTSAALTQTVQTVALEPDPLDPSLTDLFVGGTSGDDKIDIKSEHDGQLIHVKVHETNADQYQFDNTYPSAGINRVIAYGGAGNDTIKVGSEFPLPTLLFGGAGNNTLIGGGSSNILVGGSGSNVLIGGEGRNILIGGAGPSVLQGGDHSDLLIGGTTDYDCNAAALLSIAAEWNRTDENYQTRIANIEGPAGGGSAGGVNGSYYFNLQTVHETTGNTLSGGDGRDWFFACSGNVVHHDSNEVVTASS
jgi:Ca2+-binding RTX toxin-like protein